jgi:hypothetical protein
MAMSMISVFWDAVQLTDVSEVLTAFIIITLMKKAEITSEM